MNMKQGTKSLLLMTSLAVILTGFAGIGLASNPSPAALSEKVRHELLLLPFYNVFDDLSFTIEGSNTVVLYGQVTRPTLKSDAEAAVRSIPGTGKIVNNIEVLPVSPFDNSIRLATYRAIYSKPGFEKYAILAHPPIKIIVKNGHVTLEGTVVNAIDKQVADMAARMVPGVFSVTDNLVVS